MLDLFRKRAPRVFVCKHNDVYEVYENMKTRLQHVNNQNRGQRVEQNRVFHVIHVFMYSYSCI